MINQNKYVFINRLKWFGLGLIICLCSLMQPAYAYLDSEGRKINPEDWRGRWVFINYWASWCEPCLEEISEFNQFYQANKDKMDGLRQYDQEVIQKIIPVQSYSTKKPLNRIINRLIALLEPPFSS